MADDVYQQALADLAQARKFISSALSAMEQEEAPVAAAAAAPAYPVRTPGRPDTRATTAVSWAAADEVAPDRHAVAGGADLLGPAPPGGLTCREREVLALVASGLPNRNIARRLGISEKTVKNHLAAVFVKIGVSDRTQAALYAVRSGLAGS